MSYQVIARKFRPKSFAEFVGQGHVTQTLQNALASDRFPHAILLTGPRGTGKTTTARIIAKTLLCQSRQELNPCGQCDNCVDVSAGSHLDVLEIDGASHNGVDHIRELREGLGHRPTSGKYKVYIIDEVHMLSTSAFNALLKTLEEPPDHVVFIFATTEVQKIPATILSRCQRFDFRNHTLVDIKSHLQTICNSEKVAVEEEALWIIAKQAKGSIRDSLTLLEQLISHGQGQIRAEQVMALLGLNDRTWLYKVLSSLGEQNQDGLFQAIALLRESGSDPQLFLEELLEVIRNTLLIQASGSHNPLLTLSEGEKQELSQVAPLFRPEELHLLFDVTLAGLQRLSYGSDPQLAMEMLLLKLLHLPRLTQGALNEGKNTPAAETKPSSPMRSSLSRPSQPTEVTKATQAPQEQSKPAAASLQPNPRAPSQPPVAKQERAKAPPTLAQPVVSPVVPLDNVPRTWPDFVRAVKQVNGFLGALLEHTVVLTENTEVLQLGLPEKMSFLLDKLTEAKNLERTQNFLQTFWQAHLRVEIQLITAKEAKDLLSPKAMEEKGRREKAMTEAEKIQAHPLVRATESVFKDQISKVGVVDVKPPLPQEREL